MKSIPKKPFKLNIKESYLEGILPRFREDRVKAFLTLATTLIAISIFGLFAINPTLTTIAQLKKQLQDSQFVDQKLVQKIANLSALQQSYVQLQNNLPVIMSAIPISPQIPPFAAQIQSIAQSTHFQLDKIQTLPVEITPDAPINGFLTFGFLLSGQGSNIAVTNFISLLQSYDRLVTLDQFSILRSTDNPNLFLLSIKGKTYFKK